MVFIYKQIKQNAKWLCTILKMCYNQIDMDEKQLTKISNSIKKKIGEENFAKISDDMGTLITGNAANLETIKKSEEQIDELRETNAQLITANGNLLKQVPMGVEDTTETEEAKPQKIQISEIINEKGEII